MFIYGLKQGELCRRDNDCETGLICAEVAGSDSFSCQPPVTSNKQYSEFMRSLVNIQRFYITFALIFVPFILSYPVLRASLYGIIALT